MHIFDTAEEPIEGGRENNDRDVGAAAAKERGDFCPKLACAEVVIQYGDVDLIEEFGRLFDSCGGNTLVAVLAKDGRAEMEVTGLVVEQENANRLRVWIRHQEKRGLGGLGRLDHRITSSMMLLYTTIVTIKVVI
jgi:hypothetical protein